MARKKEMKNKVIETQSNNYYWGRSGGGVYGLGFIGSAIYYISIAPTFWAGLLGILKSIFWPAFLVYGALKFFGA